MFYHLQSTFTYIIFRIILPDGLSHSAHWPPSWVLDLGQKLGANTELASPFYSSSEFKKSQGNSRNDSTYLFLEIFATKGGKTRERCPEDDPQIVLPCGNTKNVHPHQIYLSSMRNDLNQTLDLI